MEEIGIFFQNNSSVFNIIFSLVIAFQWLDRRSRGKWLENSLGALRDISGRLKELSKDESIKQKSLDLISVIDAATNTLDGKKNHRLLFWKNK